MSDYSRSGSPIGPSRSSRRPPAAATRRATPHNALSSSRASAPRLCPLESFILPCKGIANSAASCTQELGGGRETSSSAHRHGGQNGGKARPPHAERSAPRAGRRQPRAPPSPVWPAPCRGRPPAATRRWQREADQRPRLIILARE